MTTAQHPPGLCEGNSKGLAKIERSLFHSLGNSVIETGFQVYERRTKIASDGCVGLLDNGRRGLRRFPAISALILAATPGLTADLPNTKEALVPPPVSAFDWTGFYVGANAGYGLDHVSVPYTLSLPGSFVSSRTAMTERGPLSGAQVGYNYELTNVPLVSHAVVGIEADTDWADINGTAPAATALGPEVFGTRIENFGTLRGRLGYNFDRLLLYIGGGASYATVESYYNVPGYSGAATTTRLPLRFSAYTIGAEYALSSNWTIRAEYMYDYIRANWDVSSPAPAVAADFLSRATFHVARIGLNYKFDLLALTLVPAR